MYFFQDDIGLLIQHARNNFWQFLILPQAEHFAPLLHLFTYLEFKLFGLNFYGYFCFSLILHFLNLLLLYRILILLKLSKKLALTVTLLFFINLTFVEPFLWFSAQGVILANLFIALSFYFFLKRSIFIYFSILAAAFSYSTGLGLGIIFGLLSLIQGKFNFYFFLVGIISVVIGPLVAADKLGQIIPVIRNPIIDILLYLAFVIGGVGRGVFSRLFLPGFEPRHFETSKTLFSFLPFALIASLVVFLQRSASVKFRQLLLSLPFLIVYPYIWAGAVRFHFGIKQALAERYAYTPLFFTVILTGILLKYFFAKKILNSNNILALMVFILLIFQTVVFHNKAVEFEKRPLQTEKYIDQLKLKIENNETLPDYPLPSYINQPLKVPDLYPILKRDL